MQWYRSKAMLLVPSLTFSRLRLVVALGGELAPGPCACEGNDLAMA